MKKVKINTKSQLYYIAKIVQFEPLNIAKVYLIDDDCNECIATLNNILYTRGYYKPEELNIINIEKYTIEEWRKLVTHIEYERANVL